jgi:WD40 repeat protein
VPVSSPASPERPVDQVVKGTKLGMASVVDRIEPVVADAPVVAVHFLQTKAAFVLGEDSVLLAARCSEPRRVVMHAGAILACAADGQRLVTGGDDGQVRQLAVDGTVTTLASDAKRRWIDHVALAPDGTLGWSAGKQAFWRGHKGAERSHEAASTVGGLAFAPKGLRLAIAHYNGATLWFPNAKTEPERLEWKGSHLGATFSPDGRFLVTSMQESMLHGWRIADRKDMRMTGYSARVRSLDWTHDGKFLATSGATQLVMWPFAAKDGPMGKAPKALAPMEAQIEVVACHPGQEIVAVGYADGMVLLVRVSDGAEVLARKPDAKPVSALGWSADGRVLGFGTEDGQAGLIDLA